MPASNGKSLPYTRNAALHCLAPKEVAERLGVSLDTVRRWIKNGELKATRIGPKLWLIRESDLQRLFED